MKQYLVGGYVRDKMLGIESKDLDIVMVCSSYEEMKKYIEFNKQQIYQERAEFKIIRVLDTALGPVDYTWSDDIMKDLSNRDFTMNAMAIERVSQQLIDPNNGLKDLKKGIIRCVGNPDDRFREDAVRLLRAIRFKLKYDFKIDKNTEKSMIRNADLIGDSSYERIRQELDRSLDIDSVETISLLIKYKLFTKIFGKDTEVWLKAVSKNVK